jgi:predicted DNA-binding protein
METDSKWTSIRMPREYAVALKVIARKGKRSVASQASLIIEDYLASHFCADGASTADADETPKVSDTIDSSASHFCAGGASTKQ